LVVVRLLLLVEVRKQCLAGILLLHHLLLQLLVEALAHLTRVATAEAQVVVAEVD
jgi:hypothetical protein